MRGFAAPHARVPAIVLNSKDNVRARAFTLFHEVAHLFGPADMTEERADAFSAHVLMPRDAFRHSFAQSVATQLLEKIDAISRLYGVTSDAAAVRVGWLGLAPWDEIQPVREEISRRVYRPGRGGDHYRNVIARLGPGFVSRVLTAVRESAISELAAARLLGVRVDGLSAVREQLGGSAGAA